MVDDRDPLGQLVGLLQVLGGEQHGGAGAHQRPHDVPHLVAAARVEARGGFVEEEQSRGGDDARGDVEAPAHASGVLPDQAIGRVDQSEGVEEVIRPPAGEAVREPEQAAEQDQVLLTGQLLVDGGHLSGQGDVAADRLGLVHDVVAENARLTTAGGQQGGEHPDGGGLASAVGPEDAVDGPGAHGEVDAVDGLGVAEVLHQAGGFDRKVSCWGHGSSMGAGGVSTVLPQPKLRSSELAFNGRDEPATSRSSVADTPGTSAASSLGFGLDRD